MRTFRSLVLAVACAAALAASARAQTVTDSTGFEQRIAGTGQVALMTSNFGFLGTNYSSRLPSFAYPYPPTATEAIDHMVRGGLWVGAINLDEGTPRVSTGTLDGSAGSDPRTSGGPEWTPCWSRWVWPSGPTTWFGAIPSGCASAWVSVSPC